MWEWWNNRNRVNAGKSSLDPNIVCSQVERLLVDFLSLRKPEKPTKPPEIHKWEKPQDRYVKINFDGSFKADTENDGWGYIIRDQARNFVAAGAGRLMNLGSVLQAEAEACLAAIQGADKIGANRVIFESDASNLVQDLMSSDYNKLRLVCWSSRLEAHVF
jgi:hypothetical protein